METDPSGPDGGVTAPATHSIPGFTLEGLLGQGGMGLVYRATQHRPRRPVALKLLRPTAVSRRAMRRFEREAEILARLQHPSIARVYETGVIEAGTDAAGPPTPYFAMELIDGVGLCRYVEANGLPTEERVRLFISVCDAVHYAHDQGVVHRDLKPANILVDQSGQAKVLDFGIARVTGSDQTLATMQTDVGQLLGTLAYMSPEQVVGDPASIDARSDVYALGVTLYELLCGKLPYNINPNALPEAARIIQEVDPAPLSTYDRSMRGDLETIAGRCLEKEPHRRYASAEALAEDLRRYLASQPIEARPPSGWYQATRFAKRNKVLVTGLAAVFVTLVMGMVGTSLGLSQAVEAQRREAQQRAQAEIQRLEAQAAAHRAEKSERAMALALADEQRMRQLAEDRSLQSNSIGVIYRTLISEFDSDIASDEEQAQLMAMLAAAERVADDMSDLFPEAVAELRLSIGRGYGRLRRHKQAVEQFTKADQLLTESLGPASDNSVFARRGKSMEQAERVPVSDIVSELERLAAVARRIDGYESKLHATMVVDLGHCYYANRQIDDMLSFYETHYPAIALIALLEPRGIAKIESVWSWGLIELGRFDDAAAVLASLYDRRVRTLGAKHRDTLDTGFNLAHAYLGTGRTQEAVVMLEELLKNSEELFHRNPDRYLRVRRMLRRGYYLLGQTQRTLALSQEIYRESHDRFGRGHQETLADEYALAQALMQDQQYEAARDRLAYLHKANERNLGSTHLHTISTLSQLARCELALQRYDQAIRLYLDTVRRYEALLGPDHIGTFRERRILVATYSAAGQHDEALLQADLLLDDAARALGKEHPLTAKIAVTMGRSEMKAGQPRLSRETILKWKDLLADEQWGDAFFLYRTYECLAEASKEVGEPEAAARWAREAARLHEKWQFPLEQQGPSDTGPAAGRLPEEG